MITINDMIGGMVLLIVVPFALLAFGIVLSIIQFIVNKIRERIDNNEK